MYKIKYFTVHLWQPLAWSALLSSGLGLLLLHLVGVHPVQEVLPALAVLHVLDAHADPLGQDLAADALVDDNTNGALGDVEDTSSLAMVSLVGHTLLESTTSWTNILVNQKLKNFWVPQKDIYRSVQMPTLDINNVSDLVHLKIGGEVLHSRLLEATREHVSRSATVSSWVSHSDF